jgi:hypothetical protein
LFFLTIDPYLTTMLAHPSQPYRFLLFFLPALLLSSLVAAAPNPTPVAEPLRRPRQSPVPGCPSYHDLTAENKYFLRTLEAPEVPTFFKGYEGFTEYYFWDNFTITDTTPNFPAPQKGKKLPPPGKWAKSRLQFAKGLEENLPKFREIFGNIEQNPNELNYGGMQGEDCLTAFWEGNYLAKLKKPYG